MHLDTIGLTLLVLSFVSFFALMVRGVALGDALRVSDALFFFVGGICIFLMEMLFANGRIVLAIGVGVCLIAVAVIGVAVRAVFSSKTGMRTDVPHKLSSVRTARARARVARDLVTTESAMLALSLDRETQALSGAVLSGIFKGRSLETLQAAEYAILRRECERDDPEGLALLSAWAERMGMPETAPVAAPAETRTYPTELVHSRDEALNVLGLKASADTSMVQRAYQTLKARLDARDSAYLGKMLDEAYAILTQVGQETRTAMGGGKVAYR